MLNKKKVSREQQELFPAPFPLPYKGWRGAKNKTEEYRSLRWIRLCKEILAEARPEDKEEK